MSERKEIKEYFASPIRSINAWIDGTDEKTGNSGNIPPVDNTANVWLKSAEAKQKGFSYKFTLWQDVHGDAAFQAFYRVIATLICLTVILSLLAAVSFLPQFGNPANPANNEVSTRYLEQGLEETGAMNAVSSMILDYRAFDTLGESFVLFAAICSVIILLRIDRNKHGEANIKELEVSAAAAQSDETDVILKRTAFFLLPSLFLYGLYIVLNGHLSPGGGFSGGAILGAGLILYRSAYGTKSIRRFFNYKTFQWGSFAGLVAYCCLKGYSFCVGANDIPSKIPLGFWGSILSGGLILPLNICVGLVVACTLYGFYAVFCEGGI